VGDAADGFPGLPGWGDKSASAVLARYGTLEAIPANAGDWDVPGLRGAPALAATLRERMDEALLYRDLARLRTTADGVSIPQEDVDDLRWPGANRERWAAFCAAWGLARLANRPHRWLGEEPAD
jgi:5'-3' exonuclease